MVSLFTIAFRRFREFFALRYLTVSPATGNEKRLNLNRHLGFAFYPISRAGMDRSQEAFFYRCLQITLAALLLLQIHACALLSSTGDEVSEEPEVDVFSRHAQESHTEVDDTTVAVNRVLAEASRQVQHNELARAAGTLERGLSIAPGNPLLWQRLAQIKLKQGQRAQAEQFARKSNQLSTVSDTVLREENSRIIAQAKKK